MPASASTDATWTSVTCRGWRWFAKEKIMGADPFIVGARGETVKAAFDRAVEDALYEHGHSGYTGSIAEKDSYVEIELPEGAEPELEANRLIDEDDERISDKWGPAGCFALGDDRYVFFGWASS